MGLVETSRRLDCAVGFEVEVRSSYSQFCSLGPRKVSVISDSEMRSGLCIFRRFYFDL